MEQVEIGEAKRKFRLMTSSPVIIASYNEDAAPFHWTKAFIRFYPYLRGITLLNHVAISY